MLRLIRGRGQWAKVSAGALPMLSAVELPQHVATLERAADPATQTLAVWARVLTEQTAPRPRGRKSA